MVDSATILSGQGRRLLYRTMILSNKQPVKRLVVRNFKGQKLPEDFESTSWEMLRLGLNAILLGQDPPTCLEVLYKTCENLVRCNLGNGLYNRVYELIEEHNSQFAKQHVESVKAKAGDELLQEISGLWITYCQRLRMVENILMFLDRCHVLQRPELKSIHGLGVSMFCHYFLHQSGLFEVIKNALLDSIMAIRLSKSFGDVTLQKNLIFLLVDTGLFGEFEQALTQQTSIQYQRHIVNDSFKSFEYLEIVSFWLLFEEHLAESLAYPQETKARLIRIAEEAVLITGLNSLVSSGIPILVEATWKEVGGELDITEPPMNDFSELQKPQGDHLFDLRLLVKLALRANGSEVLKLNWTKFIKSYGSAILSSSRSGEMIEELLQFKRRLERVLADVFAREPAMENAMKEAFESFVNARSTKLAELIAKYLDNVLRDGKTGVATERQSDDQLLLVIDGVIVLFRFLQSKEAVEAFYKQLLSKRLLQSRSLSMDLEREVVKKFKAECGAAFTSRLEGMFKDIDSAPELNRLFKESYKAANGFEIGLTVVSSGIWPHPEDAELRLPKAIEDFQSAFATYYDEKHNGRRLIWNQNMGSCIVKAPFPQGSKELLVSVPQAVVLDCFNSAERLTFGELLKSTKMESSVLHETLLSLTGRHPILLKEDGNNDKPSKTDVYAYNSGFTSRLVRIRLNTSAAREVVEERISAAPMQLEDLQYRIDAAIVRAAKLGKRMLRPELVQQSMTALSIDSVTKADFEKRVDVLISRDFLAKDSDNPTMLSYVP